MQRCPGAIWDPGPAVGSIDRCHQEKMRRDLICLKCVVNHFDLLATKIQTNKLTWPNLMDNSDSDL